MCMPTQHTSSRHLNQFHSQLICNTVYISINFYSEAKHIALQEDSKLSQSQAVMPQNPRKQP